MKGRAPTDHPIHDLLADRWSPYAFDPGRPVAAADLQSLFEAARWTMSSYNAQPWRYIVGTRDRSPETWEKIHGVLVEGNQPWTRNAPVLALGLIRPHFEHNDKPNRAALHDLGAASALLTVEATARGLHVHQMIGIEPERAREVFDVPDELEPCTALAIGYLGQPGDIPDRYAERDAGKRERKPLAEIILGGGL